jgi:hypothetical protein
LRLLGANSFVLTATALLVSYGAPGAARRLSAVLAGLPARVRRLPGLPADTSEDPVPGTSQP